MIVTGKSATDWEFGHSTEFADMRWALSCRVRGVEVTVVFQHVTPYSWDTGAVVVGLDYKLCAYSQGEWSRMHDKYLAIGDDMPPNKVTYAEASEATGFDVEALVIEACGVFKRLAGVVKL